MKSILKPLPKKNPQNCGPYGMQVVRATAGEKPMGAIFTLKNGKYEAVPYNHHDIRRFDSPYLAQKHIEKCKPY